MAKFAVEFTYVQYCGARKIIEAKSQEEAEELAEEIGSDELKLKPMDGHLAVESVTRISKSK